MYVAIDFETANDSKLSACSIGAISFDNLRLGNKFESLIQPPNGHSHLWGSYFRIHNISRSRYMNADQFPAVWQKLQKNINISEKIIVCHNSGFDINVLRELFTFYKISTTKFYYLDTVNLGKLTWSTENYKLSTLANYLNIGLNHHDALSDATASAKIAIKSLEKHKSTDFNRVLENSRFGYGVLERNKNTSMSSSKVKKVSLKVNNQIDKNNKNKNPKKTSKFCKHCNKTKPISQFEKDKRTVDGYKTYCKSSSHETKISKVEKKDDFTLKLEKMVNKELTGYEETDTQKENRLNQEKRSEDMKTAVSQIDHSIDQNANDLNKTPSQNIPNQDNNETFHIDNSTQMSIAGLIISIFILVLIFAF